MSKIKTFYDPPPIPVRHFDWCAYDVDTYDADFVDGQWRSTSIVGWGATEEEALDDLQVQMEEHNAVG